MRNPQKFICDSRFYYPVTGQKSFSRNLARFIFGRRDFKMQPSEKAHKFKWNSLFLPLACDQKSFCKKQGRLIFERRD